MKNPIALNVPMVDLTDTTIMSALLDSLLDDTIRCLSHYDDENDSMEQQMEMVAVTCAVIRGDVEAMPLADPQETSRIAERLKRYFLQQGHLRDFTATVQDNGEYIFMALCLLTKDFVQLLMVWNESDETEEVFALRRRALVAEWVKRFMND